MINLSTNWAHIGAIIMHSNIRVIKLYDMYIPKGNKKGSHWEPLYQAMTVRVARYGPTPSIAAMRCYVASCTRYKRTSR